jgi:non-specific serine/threonine protein kinase
MLRQYRLVEKIGEGGMGEVWKAFDTSLEREVAVKFLAPDVVADAGRRARFEREARAVAALSHPNIVTIFGLEQAKGRHFFAMELVRGRTLAQVIAPGGLPPARLLEIAVPLADALGAAHDRGIIHRDLKPANIMIGDDGRLKVLDFGLAELRAPRPEGDLRETTTRSLSGEGAISGTLAYMSPEQIQGRPLDPRSDIFSLGVLLYEMATGRRPFEGGTPADVLAAVLRDLPEPPAATNPDLPPALSRLIEQCLEKDLRLRPGSSRDLRDRLAAIREETAGGLSTLPSIAVLPFADMSPAKDQGYFCDGIAEEIISALSRLRGLRVVSRTSSFLYRGSDFDLREIGRRLGVANLLEGSVRKADDRLRITVDLVSTADGYEILSAKYDREMKDVFAIQDEIAASLVEALRVTLSARERRHLRQPPARDLQAYDFYLRGRQYYAQFNRKAIEFAQQMFERTIRSEPSYARAWAGLADCASYLFMHVQHSEENRRRADEASLRALAIAPDLAEAHVARGVALSLGRDYAAAMAEFDIAVRLAPRLFDAWYFYGRTAFAAGEEERAARLWEKGMEVRPEDYQTPLLAAQIYDDLKHPDLARAARRRGVQNVEERLEMNPDDVRALYMGANGLVVLGEKERGLEWAERALALEPGDSMVLYNVACLWSMAGRIDQAIECAERAVAAGLRHKDWFEHDSNLDPLRDHPRFRALMTRLD